MKTRLILFGVACLGLMVAPRCWGQAGKPPEVQVVLPVVNEVTDQETFNGRTEAALIADLRARVGGYLIKAPFREGSEVKQGDVLFEIDPRPYIAELDRANAAVAVAEAKVKAADIIQKNNERLFKQNVISQGEMDKGAANLAEMEAGVRHARAGRDIARLNVDFTRVHAPFGGVIGRRLLDPGSLVKADETKLATLLTRDPLFVTFGIQERTYLQIRKANEKPEKSSIVVGLAVAGEKGFPRQGALDFIDSRVDPKSGALQVRAKLNNPDKSLCPGMSVRVRLNLSAPYKAMLIPESAVLRVGNEMFVFVANNKNLLEKRTVTIGQAHDDLVVAKSGLTADDRVVANSFRQLKAGMAVSPHTQTWP